MPLLRSRHPPQYTARGVAIGVFWGLTPTVGLQTFEIGATWFAARTLLRADSSLLQAFLWVWINNPVTMVPMYYVFYVTGLWLTGDAGQASGYDAFVAIWKQPDLGWAERLTGAAATVGVPTMIGCLPYAWAGGVLSYFWALRIAQRSRRGSTRDVSTPSDAHRI